MENNKLIEIDMAVATDADEGLRLDKYILAFFPDVGLRQRRRIIENGLVTVNERKAKPGLKLFTGARVVVFEQDGCECADEVSAGLKILKQTDDYAVVYKPEGLHSAKIAGGIEPSAEGCFPKLFSGREPVLINRLDQLTSGMLLVAFGHDQVNIFKDIEEKGQVDKFYLAKVHGVPESEFIIKNRLDTDDRAMTKVLEEDAEHLRWSRVKLIEKLDGDMSLVEVEISKGARHQIRVHLAHAGFPIAGDPVYGKVDDAQDRMYLHHNRITFPGFEAECDSGWK
ncbi:RluA family pseudouridine synthase [Maridesulfovibrio hydrothermalis]|uniref:Pseudouridine synthase n=1 Tax=Maridesulfovibrio hydrothermalis AM13 = DSM 14728 TaxID=1121451 RepID=L0RBF0_9BACT|nr:RluA family pseudouridine synthase [Maridesulfovibrio hydrothermalis]CCO24084.1 Pseudouridine synthase [Maridesulfovibrio hydrothermalis AM13 = DSM 14728]